MASPNALDYFYVAGTILVGTTVITLLLKYVRVNVDTRPFFSTKTGRFMALKAQNILEQSLKLVAVADPFTPPQSATTSSRGYLETLPQRRGSRPVIEGISSPIQKTQITHWERKNVSDRLRKMVLDIPERYPQSTYLGRSTFEPNAPVSLYARHRAFNETKYYGEILSVGTKDGLMQASLHPNDVKIVIEQGWGQRHSLSGRYMSHLSSLVNSDLPRPVEGSRVLLYAPRNDEDLQTLRHIFDAAVWWVGGIDYRHDDEKVLGGFEI